MNAAAWICLLAPLAGALAIALARRRGSRAALAGYISTGTTMVAFAAAVVAFVIMLGESPDARAHVTTSWTWLSAGKYSFGFTLLTDQLSVMMMLIVAGVGSLIVAYSVGYMEGEDEERRYFAYMSLFVFSMLLLVQSGNLLLLLAGWGMVGLSSYLLIGFYQERPEAIAAAKKAFVMNAIGDATIALALFLLIQHTGQLDYAGVFAASPNGGTVANLIALGLLGGAVAKSAQIPLHTWLPDAMEGPTPVSALIHAATMVTAGVYLIVRTHVLFQNAPHVAGSRRGPRRGDAPDGGPDRARAGRHQARDRLLDDVADRLHVRRRRRRRVLGRDVPPDDARVLQGAALPRRRDRDPRAHRRAGHAAGWAGSGRRMPYTRNVFLIGALALVGIPPLSGFFSKDSIIAATLDEGRLRLLPLRRLPRRARS